MAINEHSAAAATQWNGLELADPPADREGYDSKAFLLVGALS